MVSLSRIPKGPKPWPSRKHNDFLEDPEDMALVYHSGRSTWHPVEGDLVGYVGLVLDQTAPSSKRNGEPGQSPIAEVYVDTASQNPHIAVSPKILNGKPCIKGTRIPVALVLRYLAVDDDPTEDLDITKKDVSDCLQFAATVCDQPLSRDDD